VLITGELGVGERWLLFGGGSGWLGGKSGLFGRGLFDGEGGTHGSAPIVGAEGVDVFVLGDGERLDKDLAEISEGGGGFGFDVALGDGGKQAAKGGADVASGDELAGEKASDVFAGFFAGESLGFLASMAGAERGMARTARDAATAAVGEGEGTEGRAVRGTNSGHGSLQKEIFDV